MRKTIAAALLAALLLLPSLASGQALTRAEQGGLKSVAKAWTGLAKFCKKNKLPERGLAAVAKGLAAAPDDKTLLALKGDLDAMGEEDDAEGVKKYKKESAKVFKKIAGYYGKLYRAKPPKDAPGRFYDYLIETVKLCPEDKRTWTAFLGAVAAAVAAKDMAGAGRLIGGAQAVGPPKSVKAKFQAVLVKAALNKPITLKASDHEMLYILNLPKSYNPRRKCWILVTCEGAGSNFPGNHRSFANRRGDLPVIIITPHTFSTTNALVAKKYKYPQSTIDKYQSGPRITFDEEGILNALKDVKALFSCHEKFFITGFSGGGNPTYLFIFKHPDMLAGAVPACANFSGQGLREAAKPGKGLEAPIKILTGENDPHRKWTHGQVGSPGIEAQTDEAEKLLKKWGYTKYERIMVPGAKHVNMNRQVMEFIKEVTGSK